MKKHNPKLILPLFLFCVSFAFAQQDFHLALYKYHSSVFNPAFLGTQNGTFLNTSFRSQWTGIKEGPRIQALSIGFPTGEKRAGYGLLVTNENTFIQRQTKFYGTFSYRLPVNDHWNLHLGISAGGNNFAVDFNQLENLQQTGDGQFQNISQFNPNVGVGAYLKHENFFFSLSAPQLLATKRAKDQQGISTSARDRPHVYAITGYTLALEGDWSWVNSALVRYVSDAPLSAVINSGVGYKNIEATVGYQVDAGISGTLMIQEFDDHGLALGYSYQVPTQSDLIGLTGGNHEVLLRIRLGKTKAVRTEELPSTEETSTTANP